MPRIKNFLIDNTLGKVFTNVQNVASANASNLIAGTKLQTKSITTRAAVPLRITNQLSNQGILFPTDSLVIGAKLTLAKATTWTTTRLAIRSGTSYESSTVVEDNISISANSRIETYTFNISVPAGNYLYIDIIDASPIPTNAGAGLSITINFYAN